MSKLGISIDLNPYVRPYIMADAQKLPIKDNAFALVLVDPPYNQFYVEHYSSLNQNVPPTKPKLKVYHAFREVARVTNSIAQRNALKLYARFTFITATLIRTYNFCKNPPADPLLLILSIFEKVMMQATRSSKS